MQSYTAARRAQRHRPAVMLSHHHFIHTIVFLKNVIMLRYQLRQLNPYVCSQCEGSEVSMRRCSILRTICVLYCFFPLRLFVSHHSPSALARSLTHSLQCVFFSLSLSLRVCVCARACVIVLAVACCYEPSVRSYNIDKNARNKKEYIKLIVDVVCGTNTAFTFQQLNQSS